MKSLAHTIAALILGSLLATALTGCGPLAAGADPVVVNGERSIQASFGTVDAFLQFDHLNRATLKASAPAVHATAEALRRTAPAIFRAAWAAMDFYKTARTAVAAADLDARLTEVESAAQAARSAQLSIPPVP